MKPEVFLAGRVREREISQSRYKAKMFKDDERLNDAMEREEDVGGILRRQRVVWE